MAVLTRHSSSAFGYSSIVVLALLLIDVIYFLYKYPISRTRIGYSALVAAAGGLIYHIIYTMGVNSNDASLVALFVFHGLYNVFTLFPGIIAFHNISKQRKSELGTFIGYMCYAQAAIIPVIGLILTIATAIQFGGRQVEFLFINQSVLIFFFLNWGFIVAYIIYVPMHLGQLKDRSYNSLIAYVILSFIYTFSYTFIVGIGNVSFKTYQILIFLLVTLPMALSIIIAIAFSYTWTLEPIQNNNSNDIEAVSTDNKSE